MPGPYFFAYADEGEAFNAGVHNREDEAVLSFSLTHTEGDFAGLTVNCLNPGEGLLAPGRQQWAWLSWYDGAAIQPLFYGRLVAVPESIDGETVRLLFSATPMDYDTIKADLADTLRVLPYYDQVWISGDTEDDDSVLNAYGRRWHIGRTDLALTTSDELTGEDGTLSIGEADHLYDNFEVTYGQPPLSEVKVEGSLGWKQSGSGTVDLTYKIYSVFKSRKTIYTHPQSGVISSLTGDGLMSDWPKPGTSLGGGWTVSPLTFCIDAPKSFKRYTYLVNYSAPRSSTETSTSVATSYYDYITWIVDFPVSALQQKTYFDWVADRGRTEIIKATVIADIQPLLAEPTNDANIGTIKISASDTVTAEDNYGLPIGDTRRKSYLNTDRGALSVQYLMLLARAELRRRARAVEVKFRVPWAKGVGATLRKNAQIADYRLPGGEAIGKVISYEMSASGTGEFYVEMTIGCAIGRGGTVSAAAGDPTYVNDGYVAAGYQIETGAQVTAPTGDIVYESLADMTVDDDGVDLLTLDSNTAVQSLTLTGGLGDQTTVVTYSADPVDALKSYPSRPCLQLVPVAGMNFSTTFEPTVEMMPIPKTIDLEAAAAG
jgi:hypothetical protein